MKPGFLKRALNPAVLYGLTLYASGLGMRFTETYAWKNPELFVRGERLLPTPDSYRWLAGCIGLGAGAHSPLSQILKLLSDFTRASPADIAFYLPLFLAPLTGVGVFLFARRIAGNLPACWAGIMADLSPGFYLRTRLGFYDSDLFTLFLPLLTATFLAGRFSPLLEDYARNRPFSSYIDETRVLSSPRLGLIPACALTGLLARFFSLWHETLIPSLNLGLFLTLILLSLFTGKEKRNEALWAGYAFGLCALAPPPFMLIGLAILTACHFREQLAKRHKKFEKIAGILSGGVLPLILALAVTAMTLLGSLKMQLAPIVAAEIEPGLKTSYVAQDVNLKLPDVTSSISERDKPGLSEMLGRSGSSALSGAAGVAGFLLLAYLRPWTLFLLPFLILSASGYFLGARFAMFGSPAVATGLCIPLFMLLEKLPGRSERKKIRASLFTSLIALSTLTPLIVLYAGLEPAPAISPAHAEALVRLKSVSPENSLVLTWWDFGYAAQYYSGRQTTADGGRHDPLSLLPLAAVYAAQSPEKALDILSSKNLAQSFAKAYGLPAESARNFFREKDIDFGNRRIYLVIPWDCVKLLSWVVYFGTWDIRNGEGTFPGLFPVSLPPRLERETGRLVLDAQGAYVNVREAEMISGDRRGGFLYPDNNGPYLLVNSNTKDAWLMDEKIWRSNFMRLFLRAEDSSTSEYGRYRPVVNVPGKVLILEVSL